MNLIIPSTWTLPDAAVTCESVCRERRRFLKTLGRVMAVEALGSAGMIAATAGSPSRPNPAHRLEGLTLTKEKAILGYTNFIEFSFKKEGPFVEANKGWKTEPWKIEVAGLVAKPPTF